MKKIIVDENDNQVDIWEIFRKQIWKDVYIPKNLREKYKIKYDAKNNIIHLKEKTK